MTGWTLTRIIWFGAFHLALSAAVFTVFWLTWVFFTDILIGVPPYSITTILIGEAPWYEDVQFNFMYFLGVLFGFITAGLYFRWVVRQMLEFDWDEIP